MRARMLLMSLLIAVGAVCLLRTRLNRPLVDEGTAAQTASVTPDGLGTNSRSLAGPVMSPRLAAAYSPGVVVLTNGVLNPDTRQRADTSDDEWARYLLEHQTASEHGANAKVTFHVVDAAGESVPKADVIAKFFGDSPVKGVTDMDGLFTAQGRTLHGESLLYTVNKQGYYQTRAIHQFGKTGVRCLEGDRWIPWNPTHRVTLKDIRKPIPMFVRKVDRPVPVHGMPVGFDLEAGDWVAPYGTGVVSDLQLTYVWAMGPGSWRRHELTIGFTNSVDCAYSAQKDEYCLFMSDYEAKRDAEGSKELHYVYERTDSEVLQDRTLTEHQLVVFRVRTKLGSHGEVREARYGKVYGPLLFAQGHGKHVQFRYYLNPNANDPNLEFDGVHNLADPLWRGPVEPR